MQGWLRFVGTGRDTPFPVILDTLMHTDRHVHYGRAEPSKPGRRRLSKSFCLGGVRRLVPREARKQDESRSATAYPNSRSSHSISSIGGRGRVNDSLGSEDAAEPSLPGKRPPRGIELRQRVALHDDPVASNKRSTLACYAGGSQRNSERCTGSRARG